MHDIRSPRSNGWCNCLCDSVAIGAMYCDCGLRNGGFNGEGMSSGTVLAVKTHNLSPPSSWERGKYVQVWGCGIMIMWQGVWSRDKWCGHMTRGVVCLLLLVLFPAIEIWACLSKHRNRD